MHVPWRQPRGHVTRLDAATRALTLLAAATRLDAQRSCGELNAARRSLVSSAITPVNPSIMG